MEKSLKRYDTRRRFDKAQEALSNGESVVREAKRRAAESGWTVGEIASGLAIGAVANTLKPYAR